MYLCIILMCMIIISPISVDSGFSKHNEARKKANISLHTNLTFCTHLVCNICNDCI